MSSSRELRRFERLFSKKRRLAERSGSHSTAKPLNLWPFIERGRLQSFPLEADRRGQLDAFVKKSIHPCRSVVHLAARLRWIEHRHRRRLDVNDRRATPRTQPRARPRSRVRRRLAGCGSFPDTRTHPEPGSLPNARAHPGPGADARRGSALRIEVRRLPRFARLQRSRRRDGCQHSEKTRIHARHGRGIRGDCSRTPVASTSCFREAPCPPHGRGAHLPTPCDGSATPEGAPPRLSPAPRRRTAGCPSGNTLSNNAAQSKRRAHSGMGPGGGPRARVEAQLVSNRCGHSLVVRSGAVRSSADVVLGEPSAGGARPVQIHVDVKTGTGGPAAPPGPEGPEGPGYASDAGWARISNRLRPVAANRARSGSERSGRRAHFTPASSLTRSS
jgi:hypothetical protein